MNYDIELLCPACGDNYLHHDKVEVFERCGEDSETGFHATIENMRIEIDRDMAGNPSQRRDGMKIEFYCEGCEKRSVLKIVQHKGITYQDHAVIYKQKKSVIPEDSYPGESMSELLEREQKALMKKNNKRDVRLK
jgi:hypothetical protein